MTDGLLAFREMVGLLPYGGHQLLQVLEGLLSRDEDDAASVPDKEAVRLRRIVHHGVVQLRSNVLAFHELLETVAKPHHRHATASRDHAVDQRDVLQRFLEFPHVGVIEPVLFKEDCRFLVEREDLLIDRQRLIGFCRVAVAQRKNLHPVAGVELEVGDRLQDAGDARELCFGTRELHLRGFRVVAG